MHPTNNKPVHAYAQIKNYVRKQIESGVWPNGSLIPSEHDLVKQFSVSRMTVHRALRELTAEQVLTRIQGAGTFVSAQKYQSTLIEIKSIAEEIKNRGDVHSSEVLILECTDDSKALAALGLPAGPAFHSRIVHYENEVPIQLEDRYVNPKLYPHYLEQNFTLITPNEYMTREAPLQRAEYVITATMPDATVRHRLRMDIGTPCLVLHRRTWAHNQVATDVTLWHPGTRYQFSGSV
ncbi:histidine utilization repressor [Vogesella sp. LIG4]|uniref:histidine utilization repressor n=1 Tax=Vogesella sp. LIG4 TaxID=1192162 RepID=UPI00081FC8FC|nr:histidine utilization repressor [Vogesella sp. LIG4]SCK14598.1 GntR family transcriptional regulator, histidine utilization repressor [Vogesella sp. LIG4]